MARVSFAVAALLSAPLALGLACSDDPAPTDAGLDPADAGVVEEAGVADTGAIRDATVIVRDGGLVVRHDAGAPPSCTTTCDCPQGLACLDGVCRTAGVGPVYCCDNPGCPQDQACLNAQERPGRCPTPPDAGPDAGPRDTGAGTVGSGCTSDQECNAAAGITCWEQNQQPFLWGGYCTVEGCIPGCPTGSICIAYNTGNPPLQGCMQQCVTEQDCRDDAYCFEIPNSGIRICLPDCRDDLFDCAPRDGTTYCSRVTGECEITPMQTTGASVGDPCTDNRDCGSGQICMGQFAWGLPGGMCTSICSGLPEAAACEPGESCQMFAGVGMCFKNCVNNACPDRAGAMCARLDQAWPNPSCIPQ